MTTHLTDTQKQTIRIALATWEGWTECADGWHLRDDDPDFPGELVWSEPPNYPASLDACHAIEVKLTDEQYRAFGKVISDAAEKIKGGVVQKGRAIVSASAEHRSLALFRALNLGELGD